MSARAIKHNSSSMIGLDIGSTAVRAVRLIVEDGIQRIAAAASIKCSLTGLLESKIGHVLNEILSSSEVSLSTKSESVVIGFSDCLRESTGGIIRISSRPDCITHKHVRSVVEAAHAIRFRSVLDSDVISFEVDEQRGIANPLGMSGINLSVNAKIITTNRKQLISATAACKKAKLKIICKTSSTLALAGTFLSVEELESGICLLDIGGKFNTMAIYKSGKLYGVSFLYMTGNLLTDRIAARLKVKESEAEKLKIDYANGSIDLDSSEQTCMISLGAEVGSWTEKLCKALKKALTPDNDTEHEIALLSENLVTGIVLTGRSSKLPGLQDSIQRSLGVPVRHGVIQGVNGLDGISQEYASSISLALKGLNGVSSAGIFIEKK